MEINGRKWPLPASEAIDHPVHGKGVRYNFALNHLDEDLIRNRGRYVAWSMDGSRVLASGATMGEMYAETHRLGLIGDEFIAEYITEDA
jgi:hypothetical protein